jgi:hypothetical protein
LTQTHIPSDQFARCTDELRKLMLLVDDVQRCVDVASNVDTYDARRSLALARTDIQTAGFWLGDALKALARKPSEPPEPASATFGR